MIVDKKTARLVGVELFPTITSMVSVNLVIEIPEKHYNENSKNKIRRFRYLPDISIRVLPKNWTLLEIEISNYLLTKNIFDINETIRFYANAEKKHLTAKILRNAINEVILTLKKFNPEEFI